MKKALQCLALLLIAGNAHAVEYYHAKITGVGVVAGEDRIRFTIDKDPNVVLVTNQFSGEQLKRLVALVTAAYAAESDVYFIRSAESTSSTTRHYAEVTIVALGAYTFD